MPLTTPRILALLALVLSVLSPLVVVPPWIPILLLSLALLIREGAPSSR